MEQQLTVDEKSQQNVVIVQGDEIIVTKVTPSGYGKVSHCFCKTPPLQDATPKIKITKRKIFVNHATSEGGRISTTTLEGTGGRYTLGIGEHEIEPGTYTHYIGTGGSITNRGEVHSYVHYD